MVVSSEGRQPVLHRVGGGSFTWNPNVNFTEWGIHEQFYVGDWLYFGFNKQLYSVLQVNKTSYEGCMEQNFIKNITKGGRDVFNLTEAKPYYFISGGGYCFEGMKVAIIVQDRRPSFPRSKGYLPTTWPAVTIISSTSVSNSNSNSNSNSPGAARLTFTLTLLLMSSILVSLL